MFGGGQHQQQQYGGYPQQQQGGYQQGGYGQQQQYYPPAPQVGHCSYGIRAVCVADHHMYSNHTSNPDVSVSTFDSKIGIDTVPRTDADNVCWIRILPAATAPTSIRSATASEGWWRRYWLPSMVSSPWSTRNQSRLIDHSCAGALCCCCAEELCCDMLF